MCKHRDERVAWPKGATEEEAKEAWNKELVVMEKIKKSVQDQLDFEAKVSVT